MKIEAIFDQRTNTMLITKKSDKHKDCFFIGISDINKQGKIIGTYLNKQDLKNLITDLNKLLDDDK